MAFRGDHIFSLLFLRGLGWNVCAGKSYKDDNYPNYF